MKDAYFFVPGLNYSTRDLRPWGENISLLILEPFYWTLARIIVCISSKRAPVTPILSRSWTCTGTKGYCLSTSIDRPYIFLSPLIFILRVNPFLSYVISLVSSYSPYSFVMIVFTWATWANFFRSSISFLIYSSGVNNYCWSLSSCYCLFFRLFLPEASFAFKSLSYTSSFRSFSPKPARAYLS